MQTYTLRDNDLLLSADLGLGTEKKYIFKIRDLPHDKRPREKLQELGPNALTTQELLAVILSTGSKKEEIMAMSERIIKEYGENVLVHERNPKRLSENLQIPIGKAMQIVAVGELGRRFFEKREHGLATIRTPKDVYNYVRDLRNLPKEHLRGLYLNTHHMVIHDEVISIGTVNANLIHPREVFRPAIEYGAAGIILVHNHPSGEVVSSQSDREVTQQLIAAGKIIGINIVDHVIVGREGYTSVEAVY